jgi:hypothetical protein
MVGWCARRRVAVKVDEARASRFGAATITDGEIGATLIRDKGLSRGPEHSWRASGAIRLAYATKRADRKERIMRIALAIVVAGIAGSVLAAVAEWKPLGENSNGNKIYVDKASIKAAAGVTTVTYRTELKTPIDTVGGGITSMRSQMRVNCKDMTAAGVEVILFEDEAKNRAFARNKAAKIEYLKEPAGSSADLVVKFVCGK